MKKIIIVAFVCLLLSVSVLAKEVVSMGYGNTAKLAEADALRNAVENVMGMVVDSTTITEKHQLIEDNVLTHSRGYITDYEVLFKNKIKDGWQVQVRAGVDTKADSKLMNDLVKLGIIDLSLRNPRIAVLIYEDAWTDDSVPAETALIKCFLDNGFEQMVNTDAFALYRRDAWRYDLAKLRTLAAHLNADIVVVGKAIHNNNGDVGRFLDGSRTGMLSCRAQIDARMYSAKTGRIIASDSKVGSGADISKRIAARAAVSNAAEELGKVFTEKLIADGAGNRQYVTLVVKADGFQKMNLVRRALENIPQVKSLQLREYRGGQGLFQMRYAGSPEQLFRLLQKQAECNVVMETATYDGLVIKAY